MYRKEYTNLRERRHKIKTKIYFFRNFFVEVRKKADINYYSSEKELASFRSVTIVVERLTDANY